MIDMPAIPPKLTPEQRRQSLIKAGIVRKRRADVKHQIKKGEINFALLLEMAEKEEALAGIKVLSVLESIPGIGKVKARRRLAELNISEIRRVKGLSLRQKNALLGMFSGS